MTKKNILFLNGIPDDGKIIVISIGEHNQLRYKVAGNANISDHLDEDLITPFITTFDLDAKQALSPRPGIDAVFNQISDADSHKVTLMKAELLYNLVSDKLPFFNSPANIKKTTRDSLYQILQGIDKLHVPKTVRIQPESPSDIYQAIKDEQFEFPVIFRQAGDHGGVSTIKLDDTTEQFYPFSLDGRTYYLTQFIDYKDKENDLYIKYRLVVIGGKVFVKSVMPGEQWLVHHATRLSTDEGKAIEQKRLDSFSKDIAPSIQPTITEIHNRLGLDYFGIDCHIDQDHNILVFEINANMNVFSSPSDIQIVHTEKIRKALEELIVNSIKQ